MFKTRLLSGIVLVIAALVLIITGGDVLLVSTLLISWIGMFELYRIFILRSLRRALSGMQRRRSTMRICASAFCRI